MASRASVVAKTEARSGKVYCSTSPLNYHNFPIKEVGSVPGTYTYTLQVGRTSDGDGALSFVNGGTYTGLVANEVYTLTNNFSGVTQVAKLTDSDGTVIDNATGDDWDDGRLKYNGAILPKSDIGSGHNMAGVYFNANFSESRVIPTPDTPAVPEPTTATLSLLALAGLAARRRRK